MVAPITGPINSAPSVPFANKSVSGYKQVKPYNLPLSYRMSEEFGIQVHSAWTLSGTSTTTTTKNANFAIYAKPGYSTKRTQAFNQAYERLKTKTGPAAGWAENFAQWNKTRQLAVESAVRLADVVTSLRKGRFDRVAQELGLQRAPRGVSRRKHVSQNFLAYEYGVKPLMSDIQDSLQTLTGDPPSFPIRARSRENFVGRTSSLVNSGGFYSRSVETYSGVLEIRLQARLRLTNPDLFLATKLGLLDFALPWKLIPFSFVVDWFVNVEDVISSLSDWYGCTLEHPVTTEFCSGEQSSFSYTSQTYPSGQSEGSTTSVKQSSVRLIRSPGISSPTLQVKPFKGFSLERGAQAIALVLSVLGK